MKHLMPDLLPDLLRQAAFRRIWLVDVVVIAAMNISALALPIVGTVMLSASPSQMGVLVAIQAFTFALLSLPTGVWVDRFPRTWLIRWSFLLLALGIGVVPLAWWLGSLSMGVLYVSGAFISCVNSVFGTAHQVLVTHTVGRAKVVDAHRINSSTESVIRMAAPAAAGLLIEAMGAPRALILEVFAIALGSWMFRRVPEPVPDAAGDASGAPAHGAQAEGGLFEKIRQGLLHVWHDHALRTIACVAALWQCLFHGFLALQVLYATRELLLSPGQIGLAHVWGGLGALLAGYTLKKLNATLGPAKVMALGLALTGACWGMFALMSATPGWSQAGLSAAMFVFDFGAVAFFVNYISMRQIVTPDALLGRVTSTMRFLSIAPAPIGAILLGLLAENAGLRPTFALMALLCTVVWVVLLKSRAVRKASDEALSVQAAAAVA